MCLIDKKVNHKKFGDGTIKSCDGKYLHVLFGESEKIFSYPSVFEKFLTIDDKEAKDKIKSDIEALHEKSLKLEETKKKKEIQYVVQPIEPQKNVSKYLDIGKPSTEEPKVETQTKQPAVKTPRTRTKTNNKNLAIKFNYCDGGQIEDKIGFSAICSNAQMEYNINRQKNNRICNSSDCVCKKALYGEINEEEFKKIADSNTFVCNESQLLKNWRVRVDSSKLATALNNSLIIMTTKFKSLEEKDRFVFGVFMTAGTIKDGDFDFVIADKYYKIELKKSEAIKVKFWNHYTSTGKTKNNNWGTTAFKILTNEDCLSILKEIVNVKTGTEDEEKAKKLYDYFAEINDIDLNAVEEVAEDNEVIDETKDVPQMELDF